jgi:NADPH-dependent glutamate synthase beta subunit-like oxidoreductase
VSIELVDRELCNGCGLCVVTCPLDVIRLDTEVADLEEQPDCRRACPAGVDMRTYLYLLKNGQIDEAMEVLREYLPLPAVTGRVCPHPCESECARKEVDEAVNINALERFVADRWLKEKARPAHQIYAAKVAVVGSGPAGLSCAYFLARMGYAVTVFEAQPTLGGMLRLGIPAYRLPRDVLDAQLDYIRDLGVEFKAGLTLGKDVNLEKLEKEYGAVFLAVGNGLSRRVDIDGADLHGVQWGLEFLAAVNVDAPGAAGVGGAGGTARAKAGTGATKPATRAKVGERVVVVGGGNVAIDVALTALRTGAKTVEMVCLEKVAEMPAFKEEVEQALEEGVTIHDGWGPKAVLGMGGKVTGLEVVCCTSVYDNGRQFCPAYEEAKTTTLQADTVIMAIGQATDLDLLPKGLAVTSGGAVQVDAITLQTSLPGVFAGGDVVSGPASVVQAIAAGKKAAVSIDRYLRREDLKQGRYLLPKRVKKSPKDGMELLARHANPALTAKQRGGNFKEIKQGFDEDAADREAERCMTCGSRAVISYVDECMLCLHCEHYCPQKAIYVSPEKRVAPLIPWG